MNSKNAIKHIRSDPYPAAKTGSSLRYLDFCFREKALLASFGETSWVGQNLDRILARQELLKNGIGSTQADELLKPVRVEPIRIEHGKESKSKSDVKFIEIVVMVMLLYVAVLLYGISVMRSVLEEKNSRVLEVLLSSATSTELMTGKILGVGAVG